MRWFVLTAVIGTTLVTSSIASAATVLETRAVDPIQVVRASTAAFNLGDAAASASYYARDAELFTPLAGCNPCTGRDVIEGKYRAAIESGGTFTFVGHVRLKGSRVVGRGELRVPTFPPGIERAVGTYYYTVRKGRIVRLKAVYDRSDPQTAALLAAIALQSTPSAAPAGAQITRAVRLTMSGHLTTFAGTRPDVDATTTDADVIGRERQPGGVGRFAAANLGRGTWRRTLDPGGRQLQRGTITLVFRNGETSVGDIESVLVSTSLDGPDVIGHVETFDTVITIGDDGGCRGGVAGSLRGRLTTTVTSPARRSSADTRTVSAILVGPLTFGPCLDALVAS